MPPKKKMCCFNSNLKEKYSFLKGKFGESNVLCELCNSAFSLGHSGVADVERHLKTEKHKKAVEQRAGNKKYTDYINTQKDLQVAAKEGVWAYHLIKENQSFRSSDCATKIFKICFEISDFNCARTKCEAIIKNVFAPYACKRLKDDLDMSTFVSISTDASNHGNIKMFPIVVRYFHPDEGVKIQVVNLSNTSGETSDIIVDLIKKEMSEYNITKKLVAFCGDNVNTNFGGVNRGGKNNVYAKLKENYPNLIGIGCAAHIVHNALQSACEQLDFDVELIVVKIYSHFYIYTVRVHSLMKFCQSVDNDYRKLLGYSKTRFLALLSSLESILDIFEGLKKYFLETTDSPQILQKFFSNPFSKLWCYFLKEQVKSVLIAIYFFYLSNFIIGCPI